MQTSRVRTAPLAGILALAGSIVGSPARPVAAADPVLVGAGDIADCSLSGDTATAKLLSYSLGTWRIIVFNSNCTEVGGCGPGSPQLTWLQSTLATYAGANVLAYWHHPRFSSGEHGGASSMQAAWELLYDYGADVVLNGHDHDLRALRSAGPLAAC